MAKRKQWSIGAAAALAAGMAVGLFGVHAAFQFCRFGRRRRGPQPSDSLLDTYMPEFHIRERHHTVVDAPARLTFAAACEMDLMDSPIVRNIIRARETLLGAHPDRDAEAAQPHGLVARSLAQGWGQLAEIPGREIVMGAVTQPWEASVVFRAIAPEEFAAFQDSPFVKIAWSLRAHPLTGNQTLFETETRALACGAPAVRKFRRYWALLSPGIILIRWAILGPLKREAERRARQLLSAA